jgi:hypothetical protein
MAPTSVRYSASAIPDWSVPKLVVSRHSTMIAGSDRQSDVTLGRHLNQYLRWRNANARHPDVLAARRCVQVHTEHSGS